MADMLATFYSTVAMAFAVGHGDNLADTIPLSESHPLFWLLHQAVQDPDTQLSPKAIMRSLNIAGLPQDIKWPIASILSTVLIFVRDRPAENEAEMYAALKNMLSIHSSILIKLIPAALLTGSLPAPGVLEEYDLAVFAALVQAFRNGDVARWRALVQQHRQWLRAQNIWLLLFERGEILVWRNLFRHALKAYYDAEPSAPRNRCPTWVFEEAARTAFAGSGELEQDLVLEDVICVLSSLIDQGLLMGNISYSQRQVVMRPRPDGMGGFPRLKDVTPRRVQAIT
ncbi:hypothetical protein CcaverHIS002_0408620 [Cutaneotrichosporon cavernicola]|uniref:PCI domain-containing protein n=1 Tax=Cutaneotrichosporon cavernicola TaxID=279322 RepID=A0AA48L4X2_9TREE|nr:uncharacterized protein CcaverHIS019_0408560 [Cutaneotrichosporon cavernicola]BEI84258.1 hypothetical protein CcaverHIS002_0408620 [Cutaneotrichosporon cavernicola]BEI92036.1 hypothetical protein CcaverHIS019_0408560 [Cutaneotrichosporon cavernicola]